MSQPIFPKGTKVVRGKVVARKLPTSQQSTSAYKQAEVGLKKINNLRTGPVVAPNQKTTTKRQSGYIGKSLEDPRLAKVLPKIRPGALEKNVGTRRIEGYDIEGEPLRNIDMEMRSFNPAMEGRGPSPLSKIIEALKGQKMPPSLLQELKGLDPAKLEKILALINKSRRPSGQKGTNEQSKLNAYMNRHPEDIDWNLEVETQVPY